MLRKDSTGVDSALAELAHGQMGSRDVGAAAGAPRDGRDLAAVLACGLGAVLSHVSAAVHWCLLAYAPPQPHVTALASRRGFRALCCRAGLPQPLSNFTLADLDHHPHEVDFYFPTYRLAVEPELVAERIRAGCSRAFAWAPARAW